MIPPDNSNQTAQPTTEPARRPWMLGVWILVGIAVVWGLVALWNTATRVSAPESATVTESASPSPTASTSTFLIGDPQAPVRLTYAIHWTETFQTDGVVVNGVLKSKGLRQYLEEYTKLHPDVAFQILVIPYQDYEQKLALLAQAGAAPDIYQIYAPWGVSYVRKNLLDEPPGDVQDDIKAHFVSTAGATIDGHIWGYPTEINTYALAYNKKLLAAAGVTAPPATWAELLTDAKRLTKRDAAGHITQYGISFLRENDWQVVDPFLSLLFTNNGAYLSDNLTKPRFQEQAGVEALDGILALFHEGATDVNGNFFDFKDGKVAMVITPPWTKAIFQSGFGATFSQDVGIAPLPYLQKPATLQYSWFMGVLKPSGHRTEAWNFLRWFAAEVQPSTGTTRYGDLLAETIGAIPSRTSDIAGHSAQLNDSFTKGFVDALKSSVPEPNAPEAGAIKKVIMSHIENAWDGTASAAEALNAAASEVQVIIDRNAR